MLTTDQTYLLQQMGMTVWKEKTASSQPLTSSSLPDWNELRCAVEQCQRCDLAKTRTQVVFGVGNIQADLVIVGEAPGANEDRLGEPFVGRAGQLLDAMLKAMDLNRQDIYICNILKCRPPNNRDPSAEEIASCTSYLEKQLLYIQPKLILAVGRIAAQYLLGLKTPLSQLRSQLWKFTPTQTDLLVTYHPAYLLRNPKDKAKAYDDLLQVKTYLT